MKKSKTVGLYILAAALGFAVNVRAAEEESGNSAKRTIRQIKDEICPVVNGKIVCAEKKIKHKVQNISDRVKSKVEDAKSKSE